MKLKTLGGILLIVGTSIGGGMLALPVATAPGGFLGAALLLFLYWLLTTSSALLLLEVNLWLPPDSNLISMAKLSLGLPGQIIAWNTYLLLLYALLAAYISSGADILGNLASLAHIAIHTSWSPWLFVTLLGFVVYKGIHSVDIVNRALMLIKLTIYLGLIFSIIPHVAISRWFTGDIKLLPVGITTIITSFGFAVIIPSLRSYFQDDIPALRKALLIGTFIPLLCYLAWEGAILGVLPREGSNGLLALSQSSHATTDLTQSIDYYLHTASITNLAQLFTSICVTTSFLGIALSLSDFLSDGLRIKKRGWGNLWVYLATFAPALMIAIYFPRFFIQGLSYAGIFCTLLLILLPACMAWSGRYWHGFQGKYRFPGGRISLSIIMLLGILSLVFGFL